MQTADPGAFGEVAALLDGLVASHVLPGASVLVQRAGEEVFSYTCGLKSLEDGTPVRRDTLFRLFSMTKPVTAAAAMILVDDGALRLEDLVTDRIPEFGGLGVHVGEDGGGVRTEPARPMTLRHLLTHTAGFSYWFYPHEPVGELYAADPAIGPGETFRFDPAVGGLDGLARALGRLPLVSQPGERWHYSMSIDVAGIVISRAAGQPLEHVLQMRLFEPLGMTDTAFSVAPGRADRLASLYTSSADGGVQLIEGGADSPLLRDVPGAAGGGGLVSTLDDYGRFAEMLRRGGELDGRRVLSEASVRAMTTNQLAPEQLAELPALAGLGLGGAGDGLGFGLGGAVVLDPPANGVPVFRGEYSWGGGASTTF